MQVDQAIIAAVRGQGVADGPHANLKKATDTFGTGRRSKSAITERVKSKHSNRKSMVRSVASSAEQ